MSFLAKTKIALVFLVVSFLGSCASVAPTTAKALESLKVAYTKVCVDLPFVATVAAKECSDAKAGVNHAIETYNDVNSQLPEATK